MRLTVIEVLSLSIADKDIRGLFTTQPRSVYTVFGTLLWLFIIRQGSIALRTLIPIIILMSATIFLALIG
jgi:hypothetical protein